MRYIHLNPLRAKLVKDLGALKSYPYSGHSALLGTLTHEWQETGEVLGRFSKKEPRARRLYEQFVEEGIKAGRRPELMGGGLLRSAGGLSKAQKRIRYTIRSWRLGVRTPMTLDAIAKMVNPMVR